MNTNLNKKFIEKDLLIVLLFFSAISLYLCYVLEIWVDEAYTLQTTRNGLMHAFIHALKFEEQPPLYFVLLTLWRKVNDSVFIARVFSYICIVFSLIVVYHLTKDYFSKTAVFVLTILLALNPHTIWAASEARVYAFVILLTSLLLFLFHRGFVDKSNYNNKRYQVLYLFVGIISAYVYYYLAFIVLINFIVLVLYKDKYIWRYLIYSVLNLFACIPLFMLMYHYDLFDKAINESTYINIIYSAKIAYWKISLFLIPDLKFEFITLLRDWFIYSLAIYYVWHMYNNYVYNKQKKYLLNFYIFITLFMITTVYISLHGTVGMQFKHMSYLLVPTIIFIFTILYSIKNAYIYWIAIGLMLTLYMSTNVIRYSESYKTVSWNSIAKYITENEKEKQPIVVFRSNRMLTLSHYYDGKNSIYGLPYDPSLDSYNLHNHRIESFSQIGSFLDSKIIPERKFWLVIHGINAYRGVDINYHILQAFIDKYCLVLDKKMFQDAQVLLLDIEQNIKSPEEYGLALGQCYM